MKLTIFRQNMQDNGTRGILLVETGVCTTLAHPHLQWDLHPTLLGCSVYHAVGVVKTTLTGPIRRQILCHAFGTLSLPPLHH